MCGIIGSFNKNEIIEESEIKNLIDIGNSLKCRGPDNFDYYIDNSKKSYLGHYRLSIIDLTNISNQPIISSCGRYILSFNGEIYNFRELSKNLKNYENKVATSDTKILVEYISQHGVEKTCNHISGMFAFAVFDKEKNLIHLARDFFGKKPLYFFFNEKIFFFSSTLKPIIFSKKIPKKINKESLNHFFQYGFCSGQSSIFENVRQVKPNSILTLNLSEWSFDQSLKINNEQNDNENNKFSLTKLEQIISKSVERRLVTDVPKCLLLSSGVDSSLVSYYASKIDNSIQTFTVGFKDKFYDESLKSKGIANYFGLKNDTILFDEKDIKKTIENIPDAYDEPFADSSQIPSLLIFEKISQHAKVAITGDGGDEIFYGYNRYQWFLIWKKFFKNNVFINKKTKNILSYFIDIFEKNYIGKKIFENFNLTSNKTQKFLKIFFKKDNIYKDFLKLSFSNDFIHNFKEVSDKYNINNVEELRSLDINNYLVDDILTKVDRASMYHSVEARSPLLDMSIYFYLRNLKYEKNLTFYNKKILLKKILYDKLPKKLASNYKRGFSVPIDEILFKYLENEIFSDLEFISKDERLYFINFSNIKDIISRFFYNKDYKLSYQVWSFYVFFKWFNKFKKNINN